jgi:hypothetical protein
MYTILTLVKLRGKMVANETPYRGMGVVANMLLTRLQLSLRKEQRHKVRWWE